MSTKITDTHARPMEGFADQWVPRYISEELERELHVTVKALKACREDSAELLAERSWWKDESRGGYRGRYFETTENIMRADEIIAKYEND